MPMMKPLKGNPGTSSLTRTFEWNSPISKMIRNTQKALASPSGNWPAAPIPQHGLNLTIWHTTLTTEKLNLNHLAPTRDTFWVEEKSFLCQELQSIFSL
jgi:hypothetical protein